MWADGGSKRQQAIKWWNNNTIEQRQTAIELFKRNNPRYAEWDWKLIAMSSNIIELIYSSIVTCGNK
jgi:hypothetical protein